MQWRDELVLIGAASEARTNENGFRLPAEETRTTVYANRKSVGQSEFYAAQMAGYRAELKFEVYAAEYAGEPLAEYDGRRYRVLRTYETRGGELVELTLSDMAERERGGGLYGAI